MNKELGIVKYDVTDAAIQQMEADYIVLTVQGLDDEAGFKMVHEARMVVKTHRVAVEKKRKELKANALEWGRKVDSEAKRIFGLLEPIETHLQTEEDKVTKEKERIKAEKIRLEQERVERIRAKIQAIKEMGEPNFFHKKTSEVLLIPLEVLSDTEISEEIYMEFKPEADKVMFDTLKALRAAYEDQLLFEKEEAERKAEAERLEKVRKEQEAKERELEEKRNAEEEKVRLEREYIENERRKIQAEKDRIEAEKRAEQERKDRAEFERKVQEEAKARAEQEAKEKAEREAKQAAERAEREAAEKVRAEAIRPDKEKLLGFAKSLYDVGIPHVASEDAKEILVYASNKLDELSITIRRKAEAL